jgi:C4-dicarboxylate transporter, DctM subunit
MDPFVVGLISVGILFMLIILGVHIGVALALTSLLGIWWIRDSLDVAINVLARTAYSGIMDYVFAVAPLFVLMGLLANVSRASHELYDAANVVFAKVRGGLAIATVIANAIFAAITGVSVASAAIFSKIALPQMERLGYQKAFALGTVAGSSVLGMLIPPSMLFIVYGILAEVGIGKMFIAGILPGIVLTIIYSIGILVMVTLRPNLISGWEEGKRELAKTNSWKVLLKPWAIGIIIAIVLGGIWLGFFTPTEAAAVGAFGAFVIALCKRTLTRPALWEVLLETSYSTAAICLLLISAQMYSRMLTMSGLTTKLNQFFMSMSDTPMLTIWLCIVVFLILGCIIDSCSILILTVPLMVPSIQAFGFDLIWFGVVAVVAVEMGLLTPPFGMVVFAMKAVLGEKVTLQELFRGSYPFLFMMLLCLVILIYVPWLSTWLPRLM